jgi:hypothetical protein
MNCPQSPHLSQCVSVKTVPTKNGDTWGHFEDKSFISISISMQSLNSRARLGTVYSKLSPLSPITAGTLPRASNLARPSVARNGSMRALLANVWLRTERSAVKTVSLFRNLWASETFFGSGCSEFCS